MCPPRSLTQSWGFLFVESNSSHSYLNTLARRRRTSEKSSSLPKPPHIPCFFRRSWCPVGQTDGCGWCHIRYVNIDTTFLLQKLGENQAIVILVTNLDENLDSAFLRRFHFIVEFPLPDDDERMRIWKSLFGRFKVIMKRVQRWIDGFERWQARQVVLRQHLSHKSLPHYPSHPVS